MMMILLLLVMLPTFSPDRGLQKNKWATDKSGGPLLLYAELVQKKLIRHHWPCQYHVAVQGHDPVDGEYHRYAHGIMFLPLKGRNFSFDFQEALACAARVVAADGRFLGYASGQSIFLDGPHHINKQGKIRQGDLPAPF